MTAAAKTLQRNQYQFVSFEIPDEYKPSYTADDKKKVEQVVNWLNSNKKQKAWLAAVARVNKATLHIVLAGEYVSSPTKFLDQAVGALTTQNERKDIKEIDFVETQTWRLTLAVCKRARKYKDFGVLTGSVGTGKTRSLKQYVALNPNTYLIEADPCMSQRAMIDDLVAAAGIALPKAKDQRSREHKLRFFISQMKNTNALIIVDEAEYVTAECLHMLRRIRDKANLGIVLSGTERLHTLISPVGGQFDQIRSRVGMWPKPIRNIPREDADAYISLAFDDQARISEEVYDRLWFYCKGSMRMLAENLIPTIRDYGLKQNHKLSEQLIDKIAVEVLSLPKYDPSMKIKGEK